MTCFALIRFQFSATGRGELNRRLNRRENAQRKTCLCAVLAGLSRQVATHFSLSNGRPASAFSASKKLRRNELSCTHFPSRNTPSDPPHGDSHSQEITYNELPALLTATKHVPSLSPSASAMARSARWRRLHRQHMPSMPRKARSPKNMDSPIPSPAVAMPTSWP